MSRRLVGVSAPAATGDSGKPSRGKRGAAQQPDTLKLYVHGELVTVRRFGNAYMLPDGKLIRWLVW
jgi:hypothetical protein